MHLQTWTNFNQQICANMNLQICINIHTEVQRTWGWCRPILTRSVWIISLTGRTLVWIRAIICILPHRI